MKITVQKPKLKFELDEITINNYLSSFMPGADLAIQQSGEIHLKGKCGIIPYKIVINRMKFNDKHIYLGLKSVIVSLVSTVISKLIKENYLSVSFAKKELAIDIGKLSSVLDAIPLESSIEDVMVENFFIEENKIVLIVNFSGEYQLT